MLGVLLRRTRTRHQIKLTAQLGCVKTNNPSQEKYCSGSFISPRRPELVSNTRTPSLPRGVHVQVPRPPHDVEGRAAGFGLAAAADAQRAFARGRPATRRPERRPRGEV